MLKKVLLPLITLLVILSLTGYLYLNSLKPTYSGELVLKGLDGDVDVFYDDYGIPHIYAKSEADVYLALGYVHAQDRLWQMEVIRRIAPGRLSELFGKPLLETDYFFRTLGINQYSIKQVETFEKSTNTAVKTAVDSYLKGVNTFVENGPTPLEHIILGIDKTKFTTLDLYNTIGYMSFSFAAAHKTEPVVSQILNTLGSDYLSDLDINPDPTKTLIKNNNRQDSLNSTLAYHTTKILDNLPFPTWIGSNSWVVGPDMTESGEVILVNDPHIGFSQPSVWYEAHLEAPGFSLYGYHIAGYPFANLAHNRDMAIGLTMLENDDIDLFYEKVNPENANQYWMVDHWEDFQIRTEKISVKDTTDVEIKVRSSNHGPIVNDVIKEIDGEVPISMWWVYTDVPGKLFEANYALCHAQNIDETRKAAGMIHAPGLNVMYGDKKKNIAWWGVSKLAKRPSHVNPKIILDGSTGLDDPMGYYDFSQNPQAENPPWGYVYSANNQPDTIASDILYPGYYVPTDRARRIVNLLEQDKKWNVEDMKKMLLDQTSENVPEVILSITSSISASNEKQSDNFQASLDILNKWDGNYKSEAIAPVIYNKLLYKIMATIFIPKIGEAAFEAYLATHLMKRSIQPLFANDSSVWWDNSKTESIKETRATVFTAALIDGLSELEEQLGGDINNWNWKKVHILEHAHPFGEVAALKKYFNVGPFEVGAGNEVINNYLFRLNKEGIYKVTAGPSTRRIVDFNDVENNSWSILPTGQSGNVLSKHYKDQAEMYVNGAFRKQLMNEEEIKTTAPDKLMLKKE
jgi:penicillin amidase